MAVATYQALKSKLFAPSQRIHNGKNGNGITAGTFSDSMLCSDWTTVSGTPTPGATPGAATTLDRTTLGALGQGNPSAGTLRAFAERLGFGYYNVAAGGLYLLVDRLVHNGGLDGTSIAAQSNGAWPALGRYTTGAGVWAAIEIYTAIGSTVTTATMSYTNQAGSAGQTSTPIKVGGTGRNNVHRLLPLSIASGDTGVRSVASVTLAATTGTAGDFGITLFKTLAVWPVVNAAIPYAMNGRPFPGIGCMPKVETDACLQLIYLGSTSAGVCYNGGVLGLFES